MNYNIDNIANIMLVINYIFIFFLSIGYIVCIKLKEDNWKIKKMKKTAQYIKFLYTHIYLILSVLFMVFLGKTINFFFGYSSVFHTIYSYFYIIFFIIHLFFSIKIFIKYYYIRIIYKDNSKPTISI